MTRIRHLARAPIAEALIDIRVQPRDGISGDSFNQAAEEVSSTYPVVQRIESLAATFGVQEGKPMAPDATYSQIGLFLKTSDERNIVQFRTNGFTFSRLPQYTSWDEMFPEARSLWREYCAAAKPRRVIRLAVRYINRLRLPLPLDLATYLSAPPTVPEGLPPVLRAYLTRLVLNDADTGNSVIVTQALEPSVDTDHLVLLLDVDAFRDVDLDPGDSRLESILGMLRDLKNRVFFGSITEQTAEMYE
jgi:uncharacterized protein (TIGR04255 family)